MSTPLPSLKGHRIWPNALGYLVSLANPGDYGRAILSVLTCPYVLSMPKMNWWQGIPPKGFSPHGNAAYGNVIVFDPFVHDVHEHSDGTITISKEIVTRRWQGYLIKGVWYTS